MGVFTFPLCLAQAEAYFLGKLLHVLGLDNRKCMCMC